MGAFMSNKQINKHKYDLGDAESSALNDNAYNWLVSFW